MDKLTPPSAPLFSLLKDFSADPLQNFTRLAAIADIVKIPLSAHRYLINDADGVQRILQTNFANYTKAGTSYGRLATALGPGLLTNSDMAWQKRREQLQSAFHLKNLQQFTGFIEQTCTETFSEWETFTRTREPVEISELLLQLVAKISAGALLGVCFPDKILAKIVEEVHIANDYIARSATTAAWFPSLRNLRFRLAQRHLNRNLLTALTTWRDSNLPTPLLQAMLNEYQQGEMSTVDLLGEIKNIFVAGHETTGNALSWALYCLDQHPANLEQLENEVTQLLHGRIANFTDISALHYMDKVLEETLRLYPPIWIIERKVIAEDTLKDYLIPANSFVIICPYTLHRNPHYWENPEQFDPERFSPEKSQGRPKCAYIPFGMGPRVCIGKQLAMITAKIVLSGFLQRFSYKVLNTANISAQALITLKFRHGLWVELTKKI